VLEFRPYSADRLREILSTRIVEAYGKLIADSNALQQIAEFVEANGGSARHALKVLSDAIEEAERAEARKITIEIVKRVLEQERKNLILSELHELREEAPREFEVLKVITELSAEGEDVYTGLVEEAAKKKGLQVCRRSLEYYLSDLERRAFVKLKDIRIGKGHSTGIELSIAKEML